MCSPVSPRLAVLLMLTSMLIGGGAVAADVTVPTTVVQAGRVGRHLSLDGAIQPVRRGDGVGADGGQRARAERQGR